MLDRLNSFRGLSTWALVVATVLALSSAVPAAPAHAKGRILVRPKPGVSASDFAAALATQKGRSLGRIRGLGVHVVEVPEKAEEAVARALAKHVGVDFVELDRAVAPITTVPNDTHYSSAWHLPKMGLPTAWDSSRGSGVTVAVLDTGVDATHTDLSGQVLTGWNAASSNSNTSDVHGHGTMVSGVIAALSNNSQGVASIAWYAKILPVRVTDRTDGYAYFSTIASGLTWAADHGAKVANISYDATGSASIRSAASYMCSKGGVVVVAAGNSGGDPGHSDSTDIISVSATTLSDLRASWSSYGNYVDLSAPGAGIWTTKKGGGYAAVSGTSFASPATAAVAALVLAANGNLTPAQVESILETTAKDLGASGWDILYGHGRVDAAAAVAKALTTSSPPDTQAPSVTVSSPTGGPVSGVVSVQVSASDDVGVSYVDLYCGSTLVGRDTQAPFAFSWDTTQESDGSATLTAKAYDAAANEGVSSGRTVTVANSPDTIAPTVRIVSPSANASVSGTVRIEVTASDDRQLSSVELYLDGNLVATSTTGSLDYSWNTRKASSGSHTIRAVAEDAAGNDATDGPITVTIGSSKGGGGGGEKEKGGGKGKKK